MNKYRLFFITDFEMNLDFWRRLHDSQNIMWTHVGAEEIAPTTGKRHYHVTLYFFSQRSLESVIKKVRPRNVKVANGTVDQCEAYATEDGAAVLELGQKPAQGTRNDLRKLHERIESGDTIKKLVIEGHVNNYQQLKYAEALIGHFQGERNWKTEVRWYWGPTGSGKTRLAMEEAGDKENRWISGRTLRWWQGYTGQENVIIDDFRKDFCTFHELLRILDRYPYKVEFKGGSCQLLAKKIWITSPLHPSEVYITREDVDQLLRRITLIKCIKAE